ncbi:anthranilate synthase family protein [Phycicoccus flavus]|uniref:anthranilate synthase family protein n=1 Tax=Phycicoccus flavus TaxID=2502783 RepID=UPI000FEB90C5|nr:anthranilate synthase family protein [Phycicoccus flavus]NHA68450.1 phenazine biosynthesis protein PhzE [Phycicoccus flavus]
MSEPAPAPYVLMHRRGRTWLATGTLHRTRELAQVPGPGTHPVVSMVPYAQIRERGYPVHDDGEEILTLVPDTVTDVDPDDLRLPDGTPPLQVGDLELTMSDDEYAATVEAVVRDEICRGEGANFLISRRGRVHADHLDDAAVRDLFARLVAAEPNAYMTFCFFAGDRWIVGASPERHITVAGGEVTMSPICGTLPKAALTRRADLIEFITDPKEINELFQVVDEELKMMSRICSSGGTIVGPYLQEMASVVHTAYDLTGHSTMAPMDVFRDSMFAATMIGSPLENAARVIHEYEPGSRRYYTGAVVLREQRPDGGEDLDSAILIRTVEIAPDGEILLQSGGTIVRDSDPAKEVAEVVSKMQGPLNALRGVAAAPPVLEGFLDRQVVDILELRNRYLSRFWTREQHHDAPATPAATPLRVLVVDHEDQFTFMLVHALRSMGHEPEWHRWSEDGLSPEDWDLVLLGPGPGDPLEVEDPKMASLHAFVERLLAGTTPFVAVCLAHQALSHRLGLPIVALDPPTQGVQETVDLFGRQEAVGFYNTFCPAIGDDPLPPDVRPALMDDGRLVAALRGPRFTSFQFHVESVLTSNSITILREAIEWARTGDLA